MLPKVDPMPDVICSPGRSPQWLLGQGLDPTHNRQFQLAENHGHSEPHDGKKPVHNLGTLLQSAQIPISRICANMSAVSNTIPLSKTLND